MELINQVTSTQFLLPAFAVAGVLICAVLVFVFGFKAAEQPQFDKLPIVIDDRKASNKKRKTKEKKSSGQDGAKKSEAAKKSPTKEKKEQKQEPQKPKEKAQEVKKTPVKKEVPAKKTRQEKPEDFDEGEWEKVPSKSDKKRKNQDETKKDSPVKDKKKGKKDDAEVESKKGKESSNTSAPVKENLAIIDKDLQDQITEFQRALNALEQREKAGTPVKSAAPASEVKDKKTSDEAPAKKESSRKEKKVEEFIPPPAANEGGAVFDELGDTWTDAKAPKKNKKKVRKEQ